MARRYVINTKNYKFGTVSICRVPKHALGQGTVVECPVTGCLGCASGPGGQRNIFGNKCVPPLALLFPIPLTRRASASASPRSRSALLASRYGQYLAAIQVAREERRLAAAARDDDADADADDDDDDDDEGPTPAEADDDAGAAASRKRPAYDSDDEAAARARASVWAVNAEEQQLESVDGGARGSAEADREAKATAAAIDKGGGRPVKMART